MHNGIWVGVKLGIGIGIGIIAVKKAKDAYDRYMLKRKIKGLWSSIKEAWNEAAAETN